VAGRDRLYRACRAGMSTEAMLDSLMNAPLVRCDEIPWSLLGISMAGWNALISAGAALCRVPADASQEKARPETGASWPETGLPDTKA
jgi:disulfide bond formation protein DsbB